ncbi:MAG: DUF3147 family protein [Lysobacterales bacterium]
MNAQFLIKLIITVAVVLIASAVAKRSGWLGALVASLPLTSVLVMTWLYAETRDVNQVAGLSMGIFWFVLGSLPFFPVLAATLRNGWHVGAAFVAAAGAGFAGVMLLQWLLARNPS